MHKYVYLFGALLFFLYWLFLFFKLKEYRRRILVFSFLYGVIGIVSEYVYTVDWWKPETIFGSRIGIEDFLLGFTNGGLASSYLLLFFKEKQGDVKSGGWLKVMFSILITAVITAVLSLVFNFTSFYSNSIGILAAIAYIVYLRNDLFKYSVYGGLIMLIISLPIYFTLMFFYPAWIKEVWVIEKLSGNFFLGIAIEDYIWYFLVGAVISIMYPFYKGVYYFYPSHE